MTGVFRKLETSGKPWVAAINGICMGGAFELALSCHGRVAANSDKVKMALPESQGRHLPGRRRHAARAAPDRHAVSAADADFRPEPDAAEGEVDGPHPSDRRAGEPVQAAKDMIKGGLKPVQPWDEKGFKLPGGPVYSAAGAYLWPPAIAILRRETNGNYPAAEAILKCVYEGLLVPFDTGLLIERRYFTKIMQSKEAAAMIRSLFVSLQELNKGARRPAGMPETQASRRSACWAPASWAQALPM